jgi:dihydrodipicolinate synthase/N-acetylneuraminate lyase
VEIVAELAHHPNICGIKDSSGSVERIRDLVAATRTAPRRTVTVTPIFEAVTARMLALQFQIQEEKGSAFVSAANLAAGTSIAPNPVGTPVKTVPTIKTRTREVGFQILTGSAATLVESLEAGASGGVLGFAACAPEACQEIYLAWKEHNPKLAEENQQRIAAASQRIVGQLGLRGVKYACDFNGYYGGRPRAPLLTVTGTEKTEIEGLLAEIRN